MSKRYGRKTILINSAYRSNQSNSTTDFTYVFPETVKNVVHTNLLSAVIENGVYNVQGGVNDSLTLVLGANDTTPATATSASTSAVPALSTQASFPVTMTLGTVFAPNTVVTGIWSVGNTFTGTVHPNTTATLLVVDVLTRSATVPQGAGSWSFTGFASAAVRHTIYLVPGYYDIQTLSTSLANSFNNVNNLTNGLVPPTQSTFFVEADSMGYMTFTNDLSLNWAIEFPLSGTQQLLGFTTILAVNGVPAVGPPVTTFPPFAVTSIVPLRLSNYDMLLIQSDRLGNDIASRQGFSAWWAIPTGNTLANSTSITYDNVRGPVLEYRWKVPRDFEWIDIRLIDLSGKVVDIGSNNMQVLVECYTDDDARQ